MALKYGICTNKQCHLAVHEALQERDETEFVCSNPECKLPLTEIKLNGDNGVPRKMQVLLGIVFVLVIVAAVGYLQPRPTLKQPIEPPPSDLLDGDKKPMATWIQEFSGPSQANIGVTASADYRLAWQVVNDSRSRSANLKTMKEAGKIIGSEYGLLTASAGSALSETEQAMLDQENKDRRILFAFIAEHSEPPVSYERVANEYSSNQWKEWPPLN